MGIQSLQASLASLSVHGFWYHVAELVPQVCLREAPEHPCLQLFPARTRCLRHWHNDTVLFAEPLGSQRQLPVRGRQPAGAGAASSDCSVPCSFRTAAAIWQKETKSDLFGLVSLTHKVAWIARVVDEGFPEIWFY